MEKDILRGKKRDSGLKALAHHRKRMLCKDTTNVVEQFHENPKNALHRELLGLYKFGYGKFDEVIGWGLSWPMHLLRQ